MPETIVKATITGSELPFGDAYRYTKDSQTGVYAVAKAINSAGNLKIGIDSISPIPPSTYTETYTEIAITSPVTNPVSYSTSVLTDVNHGTYENDILVTAYYNNIVYSNYSGSSTNVWIENLSTHSDATLKILTSTSSCMVGLGKSGTEPNFYIYRKAVTGGPGAIVLDASYCTVVADSVLCYGSWAASSNVAYILLNPLTGIMARVYISGVSTSKAYSQLTIPAGGEILHFANSYYIAKDATTGLFLYSINAGGTLITALTPGVYNQNTPLELLDIV